MKKIILLLTVFMISGHAQAEPLDNLRENLGLTLQVDLINQQPGQVNPEIGGSHVDSGFDNELLFNDNQMRGKIIHNLENDLDKSVGCAYKAFESMMIGTDFSYKFINTFEPNDFLTTNHVEQIDPNNYVVRLWDDGERMNFFSCSWRRLDRPDRIEKTVRVVGDRSVNVVRWNDVPWVEVPEFNNNRYLTIEFSNRFNQNYSIKVLANSQEEYTAIKNCTGVFANNPNSSINFIYTHNYGAHSLGNDVVILDGTDYRCEVAQNALSNF